MNITRQPYRSNQKWTIVIEQEKHGATNSANDMADIGQRSTVRNNVPSTPNNNGGESLGSGCNTTVGE